MTEQVPGIEPRAERVAEAIANQEAFFSNTFPGMLGVRIVEAGPGHCVATLDVGASVKHPGGYAHGGALAGFGDTAAAWATFPTLDEGELFTTIEFKANFMSGVTGGRLRAEATSVHRGRRTMVIEVNVMTDDEARRPVAMMIVTQAILQQSTGATGGAEQPPEG
ncbi:MAG: PaaI family thioesterase [Actinomycetota bacterium]